MLPRPLTDPRIANRLAFHFLDSLPWTEWDKGQFLFQSVRATSKNEQSLFAHEFPIQIVTSHLQRLVSTLAEPNHPSSADGQSLFSYEKAYKIVISSLRGVRRRISKGTHMSCIHEKSLFGCLYINEIVTLRYRSWAILN